MATSPSATNQIKDSPGDDKRWRLVNATMRRLGDSPSALIESLHAVQRSFGFLDEPALRYIAQSLHVPLSKVYGVATFYNHFRMKPEGQHTCVVCLGTACYIKGASKVLTAAEQCTRIRAPETTADGKVSIVTARCLGACGIAPAAVFDGLVLGGLTPDLVKDRVERWLHE